MMNRELAQKVLHDAIEEAGTDEFAGPSYKLGEELAVYIERALDKKDKETVEAQRHFFKVGQRDMRERAALVSESHKTNSCKNEACIARAIRDLPIEGE